MQMTPEEYQRWERKLMEWLRAHRGWGGGYNRSLQASDFPDGCLTVLQYDDGTRLEFANAIALHGSSEVAGVAIFTEHLGYYVFPKVGLETFRTFG